jgi:hypothetical protein
MTQKQWIISRMTIPELNLAVDWAATEGWNPGYYDAECFFQTDPQGFFMGYLNDEPIASIIWGDILRTGLNIIISSPIDRH